jgi:hypothetical protein
MINESELQNTGRENTMNTKSGQPELEKQNERITKAIDGLRPTHQPYSTVTHSYSNQQQPNPKYSAYS